MKNFQYQKKKIIRAPGHLSTEARKWYRLIRSEYAIEDSGGLLILLSLREAFDRMRSAQKIIAEEGFAGCCKRAGIPYGKKIDTGIVPHDLRRTFKTNCMKAGVDKVLRDSLVGHSLKGMDAHYIKPIEDDLRKAMDQYTAWFDAEVSANVDQTLTKST